VTNSDLRERADKIIRLMEQRDDIATEIKDRFDDAKNAGYSAPALRKAIRVARMDDKARAKYERDAEQFDLFLSEIEGRARMAEAAE
jgi:uncharacterized protein (UPF0335 family)